MRIRSIKPEFWRSKDMQRIARQDRLLFVGLWAYVDDNGVGLDDHRQIAADLFPLEDDPLEVREYVREGLATLSRGLQITRYEVDGERYLFITNWDKHQRIDRPSKPRHPRPPEGVTSTNPDPVDPEQDDSRDPRESVASGTGEQGNRGTGEQGKDIASEVRDDVESLCSRLHDRIADNGAKATISKRWRTEARLLLDRDGRELQQALRLIDWATASPFWSPNILSMPKFREKYDQLLMQARREQQRASPPMHGTDANILRLLNPEQPLRALMGGSA